MENVKTVLCLIPLLVAVVGLALVFNERYDQFNLHANKSTSLIRFFLTKCKTMLATLLVSF